MFLPDGKDIKAFEGYLRLDCKKHQSILYFKTSKQCQINNYISGMSWRKEELHFLRICITIRINGCLLNKSNIT